MRRPVSRTLAHSHSPALIKMLLGGTPFLGIPSTSSYTRLRQRRRQRLTKQRCRRDLTSKRRIDVHRKGGHIRTVPMPDWVKQAIDQWLSMAEIAHGRIFRCVCRRGVVWGTKITEKVVWHVVKEYAERLGVSKIAPHDLRRSCARFCHDSGGELEQIQFLLVMYLCRRRKNT
jgi:site-specific recombinase XerC